MTKTMAVVLAWLLVVSHLGAASVTVYRQVVADYLEVHEILYADSMEGIGDPVSRIRATLAELPDDPVALGCDPDRSADAVSLLEQVATEAARLEASSSLEDARDAFYELSKLMVRLGWIVNGPTPAVAYCPMADRSWLQQRGEIRNPYLPTTMPRCGEFVED